MADERRTLFAIECFTRQMGIRQADLSKLAGLSRVHINQVFKGRLPLTGATQTKLADALRLAALPQSGTANQSTPVSGSLT